MSEPQLTVQMNQALIDASIWLRKLSVDYPTAPLHWIYSPFEYDGTDWCPDCAYYKCRHMRRHAKSRRSEFAVDGGWSCEAESFSYCEGCGVRLECSLNDHGIEEEISLFEECNFSNNIPAIAYSLAELCDCLDWHRASDERPDRLLKIISRFKVHYLAAPKTLNTTERS